MGDLNLELIESKSENLDSDAKYSQTEKKTITKTIVLPDGTYGTQIITIDSNSTEYNQQKEVKFLRKFLLETNFFFATNLVY